MSFNYAASGPGWRLAGSLVTLAGEIQRAHPDLTCLGTLGNTAHQAEGYGSDHNPFIKGPDGLGIVRAIDIGGPDAELRALRQQLWALYAAQDSRVWEFGYMKGCSDNLINNWGLPFGTHIDTGDAGHLHISVTQVNGNSPSPSGYVAAIDSIAPWGVADPLHSTQGGTSTPINPPSTTPPGDEDVDISDIVTRPDGGKVSVGTALAATEQYTQSAYQAAQTTNSLLGQLINAVNALTVAVKAKP